MNFLRRKKNSRVVISLLSAILFFVFVISLVIINVKRNNDVSQKYQETNAVVTKSNVQYSFGAYGCYIGSGLENACTKDQYKSYTTFGIENAYGLLAFSHSVAKGYDFSGKNVYLLGDINGTQIANITNNGVVVGNYVPIGAEMWDGAYPTKKFAGKSAFRGTFDGQNFIVSNLACSVNDRGSSSNDIHLGFFAQLQEPAIVQNLRIDNFTITGYAHDNSVNTLIGGIAGYANLTIEPDELTKINITNCLVKNLKVNAHHAHTVAGGLVGYTRSVGGQNLNFDTCMVDNFTVNANVKCDSIGGLIAKTYIFINVYQSEAVNIVNCHIKNLSIEGQSASYIANLSPARGYLYDSRYTWDNTYFSYNISKCVVQVNNSYEDVIETKVQDNVTVTYLDSFDNYSNIISAKDNTTGLDCSSNGGTSGTVWYYAAAYNGGYPKLRKFLSWTNLGFSLYGDNSIEQYVSVPSDGVDDAHNSLSTKLSNLTLDVFGQSVTAGLTDPYNFDGWTKSGNNYYAQFSKKTFKISFSGCGNTTNLSENLKFDEEYLVYYGANIKVEFTHFSQTGKYKAIKYSFTSIDGTNRWIEYYPSSGYYITGASIADGYTVVSNVSGLTVSAQLKEYKPSFQ